MNTTRAAKGLVDQVYKGLLELIIQGDLKEGDKLSTEQTLAEQFKTSRPTVREALSRLRSDGIIASRQGAGTFVTRRPDPDLPRFMPLESLSDVRRCLEFRIVVESGAAALAAVMADEADLARIQEALRRLEQAVASSALGVDEDFDFHLAVAHASKNQFFVSVLASIEQHMEFGMNLLRNLSLRKSAERLHRVQAEHGDVVQAILKRDPVAAEAAMRRHLEQTCLRMFGS
jgi:GntR family transcriptional repressor for pyruvate dehydrogenase complex